MEFIRIAKKPGIKNCIRINSVNDIPEYLKEVIRIENDELILSSLEGEQKVPLGSVIAYEKLENGKMNVWNKANYKETTTEVNGVFYEIPKINKALPLLEKNKEVIMSLLKDDFKVLEDGTYVLNTEWGEMTCTEGNGYLVVYGTKPDGKVDASFLTKGTPSFEAYYVVDESNQIIEPLSEYDSKLESSMYLRRRK